MAEDLGAVLAEHRNVGEQVPWCGKCKTNHPCRPYRLAERAQKAERRVRVALSSPLLTCADHRPGTCLTLGVSPACAPCNLRRALGDQEQPKPCPSCNARTGRWISHDRGCPVTRDDWDEDAIVGAPASAAVEDVTP
jgi:hypothetical protein